MNTIIKINICIIATIIYLTVKPVCAQIPVASFVAPDTICLGDTVNISNTSTGGNTFYWGYCNGNMYGSPGGNNLGNPGGMLNIPVFLDIAKDGNDYYAFVVNHTNPSRITRLFYGNSLLNVPANTNLGNLSGAIPPFSEGIQIMYEGTNWYGFILQLNNPDLIRLDFGNSLANIPTVVNLGNIGNMNKPHDLFIIQEGSDWYGLAINSHDNGDNTGSITRFDFGNSLVNTPTGMNLGNIGGLNYPDGFFPVNENGNWYLFITNAINSTITRMDFGNSIVNIPTGVNLGNIGALNGPRDIIIIRECDSITGYVANGGNNTLSRIGFNGGLTGTLSGTNLGNIGSLTYPHSFSEVFRVNDTLYTLIPNAFSNSISRIFFPSCTNPSVNSSTLINPPSIIYDTTGVYNINLTVNENTPFQSNYCKEIVVVAPPVINGFNTINATCNNSPDGQACVLPGGGTSPYTYLWDDPDFQTDSCAINLSEGAYSVTVTDQNNCSATAVVMVDKNFEVLLTIEAEICGFQNGSVTVNDVAYGTAPFSYSWNGDAPVADNKFTHLKSGIYQIIITDANGCSITDSVVIEEAVMTLKADFGYELIPCTNEIQFLNLSTDTLSNHWDFGDGTISNEISPVHTYQPNEKYTVILILAPNSPCADTAQAVIPFENDAISDTLFIPNIFTPNGDGKNDYFEIIGMDNLCITLHKLMVFDRWGLKVFESVGKQFKWDGTNNENTLTEGVYFYVLEGEEFTRSGSVTLLR